ncbi:O-methyltransferase [Amycolatopsis sp. cg5]|uniref:O-methyltransferase n=1 Tax=Amycolatopsis sp. cg5 TaxID=3238802 RepID=UPI003524C7F7
MTLTEAKRIVVTPAIESYLERQVEPPSKAQQRLIERTHALGGVAEMQIPHEQGVLLTLLTRIANASTVVEVGTFTGYSTLAFALGVSDGGVVHTYDISEQWLEIATEAWEEAGVGDMIKQHIGPAATELAQLPDDEFVDIVFLDADKVGYIGYWDLLVPRVRPGGLLLADNVLYAGEAADPDRQGNAAAIDLFNHHVRADERVESVLLPIADGLTIARKK